MKNHFVSQPYKKSVLLQEKRLAIHLSIFNTTSLHIQTSVPLNPTLWKLRKESRDDKRKREGERGQGREKEQEKEEEEERAGGKRKGGEMKDGGIAGRREEKRKIQKDRG